MKYIIAVNHHLKLLQVGLILSTLIACSDTSDAPDEEQQTSDPQVDTPVTEQPAEPQTPTEVELPPEQAIDQAAAARFLNQATFGATYDDIQYLVEINRRDWVEEQLTSPASLHLPLVEAYQEDDYIKPYRMSAWFDRALYADDQLRQRMAFALSEILVVSEYHDGFFDQGLALTNYYDLLVTNAFGNYRDLLEKVTLSPIMGTYLSMLGNEKPDVSKNIRPDENYAREIMQLFTIGLVELNNDGSEKLDDNQAPIPTYDQDTIKGFAHMFTGWHFDAVDENTWPHWWNLREFFTPMSPVQSYHDKGEKSLFPNVTISANQSAELDLSQALDALFNHDNLPPFISKQLIQKFVTSNPSAEYITRVTNVFIDNGAGVRGDLAAVISAILLDYEAINGHETHPDTFGKFREPILKATHMWRAFPYNTGNDRIVMNWPDYYFNQAPLSSPSVFNFYRPDYSPPTLKNATGLLAPELEIVTDSAVTNTSNFLAWFGLWRSYAGNFEDIEPEDRANHWINVSEFVTLAEQDTEQMIQRLNLVLTGNKLSQQAIDILVASYDEQTWLERPDAVANSIFLIMSSPQYAVSQ